MCESKEVLRQNPIDYSELVRGLAGWQPGDDESFFISGDPRSPFMASLVFTAGQKIYPIREVASNLNPLTANGGSILDQLARLNMFVSSIYWEGTKGLDAYPMEAQREDMKRVPWSDGFHVRLNFELLLSSLAEALNAYGNPPQLGRFWVKEAAGLREYLGGENLAVPPELRRLLSEPEYLLGTYGIAMRQAKNPTKWWEEPMEDCFRNVEEVDEAWYGAHKYVSPVREPVRDTVAFDPNLSVDHRFKKGYSTIASPEHTGRMQTINEAIGVLAKQDPGAAGRVTSRLTRALLGG